MNKTDTCNKLHKLYRQKQDLYMRYKHPMQGEEERGAAEAHNRDWLDLIKQTKFANNVSN